MKTRNLWHLKQNITTIGSGDPDNREGSDGDFTLRKTAKGPALFIKFDNRWHDVNNLIPSDVIKWHDVVFLNSWANLANYQACQYSKDEFGFVHLRGVCASGTANQPLFTLPSGFRPYETFTCPVSIYNNDECRIFILEDGTVNYDGSTATDYISIDNIHFYVG